MSTTTSTGGSNAEPLALVIENQHSPSSEQVQIPVNTLRNLCDKLKDKRRAGGDEIEIMIAKYLNTQNEDAVYQILRAINSQLINSVQPNMRKGGLWGLASASVALYRDASKYARQLGNLIFFCVSDQNSATSIAIVHRQ
jgi:hypothetical protein